MLAVASRRFESLTRYLALAGGGILLTLVAMSVASIVGRRLFNAPILGDVEIMQIGTALCAASFLPYCEMRDAHIRVDAATAGLSLSTRLTLEALGHGLLAVVAATLGYRTLIQAETTFQAGETAMLIAIPMWVPIALLAPNLALLAVAGIFRAGSALEQALECRK